MNTVGPLESQHREVEELFLRLARATDSETTTRLLAVVIRQPFHCVRHWKCVCSGGPVLPAYGVFFPMRASGMSRSAIVGTPLLRRHDDSVAFRRRD